MIIKTILDTDLYKFTTSYAYIKLFPYAMGTFSFKDRNETEYTDDFIEAGTSNCYFAMKYGMKMMETHPHGGGTGMFI